MRISSIVIVSLVLVMTIASLSLLIIKPVCAQSTKPSVPQFTTEFQNNSKILIVIENQPVSSSNAVNAIVYYYRVKDHNSMIWVRDDDYRLQSNLASTVITIPPVPGGPLFPPFVGNSTVYDFQVEAVAGWYNATQKQGIMPDAPIQAQSPNGYTEITFKPAETSDWSNTQTLNLVNDEISATTSPLSSTPNPATATNPSPFVPEFSSCSTLLLCTAMVGLIGLTVYLNRSKRLKCDGHE